MRKWMKDRLQRRKKKAPEQGSQPAPPPLQPAYFDAEQSPTPISQPDAEPESFEPDPVESGHQDAEPANVSEGFEAPLSRQEAANSGGQPRQQGTRGEGQRGRGRRRRGGRGRGGRGREQAVAQAFSPAAAKGIISALPTQEIEE